MKDITEMMHEKILGDENESTKRQTFTGSSGTDFKMPDKIFQEVIGHTRYFEIDNLKDIEDEWDNISEQKTMSYPVLAWFAQQTIKQTKDNPNMFKEMKSKNSQVKEDFNKLLGGDIRKDKASLLSKLTGGKMEIPTSPTASLYLNAVKLEKTGTIENDSFIGSKYEITDMRGNKIDALHIKESNITDMFESHAARPSEVKEKIDMMRLDPRPAVVICVPLKTNKPLLQIVKIQTGGKSIAPEVPTIGF